MFKFVVLALMLFNLSACANFKYQERPDELGQNWNESDQRSFYSTTQGSQLLKYDWLLVLEQANSQELFLAESMQRFGYLPDPFAKVQTDNSHLLPIGFVQDNGTGYRGSDQLEGPWIGMTCAACHTAEMKINGQNHLIDGAPTDADFYALISELSKSLTATVNDGKKYSRFAARVEDTGNLRADLEARAKSFSKFVEQSTPESEWGKGRLDAVGLILNSVAHNLVPDVSDESSFPDADEREDDLGHLPKSDPAQHRPRADNTHLPDAPVSYPFLWDTFQQKQNQWNGVSVATLSRNTTEVAGVFATINPNKHKQNSVQFSGLKKLQGLVTNLRSPKWSNSKYGLPPIDDERVKRGALLYVEKCANCHRINVRDSKQVDDVGIIMSDIEVVGTDETMAINFVNNTFAQEKGEKLVHSTDLVGDALFGLWIKSIFGALIYGGLEEFSNKLEPEDKDLERYKARPLNGVWATAPYLHNGSIPNMNELLKEESERDSKFCVGSREFDPILMGYESAVDSDGKCGDNFLLDTSIKGNWNSGHDSRIYGGIPFTKKERLDIIEFIKTE
jgi:hypothetical protein